MENELNTAVNKIKKYSVFDSVWIATALMSYEQYIKNKNSNLMDMCFRQHEIVKMAQKFANQQVNAARASTLCCGDAKNNTYNYLREFKTGQNPLRRLSSPEEFSGQKTKPLDLNLSDILYYNEKKIEIKELFEFVNNEYAALVKKVINKTDIDCLGILEYMEKYQGRKYIGPEKATNEEKEEMNLISEAGSNAVKELDKMAEFCEKFFGLKKSGLSKWLDGSNTKVRNYLWRQIKLPKYEENPESISIFAEIYDEKKVRFRFSLEINHSKAEKEDIQRHNSCLDLALDTEHKLVYVLGGLNDSKFILNDSNDNIKEKIKKGEYSKIQISYLVEQDANLTNEKVIAGMCEGVEALIPYYKYVLGLNETVENEFVAVHEDISNVIGGKKMNLITGKNLILYGPPGTGKTYNSVLYAVAICDKEALEVIEKNHTTKCLTGTTN